ncbi:hypothetical protein [Streptomyces candidus]|uniref:Uncharacterized protein n=1 Tax=Streptomyces candidus TaxID=67283 RepID=A0A7X0HCW6_9ACTN|nr:hypothetical protein [Streptomyces candidus]MBB6433942.1 hypothetical protein [Streptomyces candidus]
MAGFHAQRGQVEEALHDPVDLGASGGGQACGHVLVEEFRAPDVFVRLAAHQETSCSAR